MNGGGQSAAVDGSAGFENEREDERVESERWRGLHGVEEREGVQVTTLVDVRG